MKHETTPQPSQFTSAQVKTSLNTGSVLARLHATCSALEHLSAQILTTSTPENLDQKSSLVLGIADHLEDRIIDLVDMCIDLDKKLVLDIETKTQKE